jgi:hypothetical protein
MLAESVINILRNEAKVVRMCTDRDIQVRYIECIIVQETIPPSV